MSSMSAKKTMSYSILYSKETLKVEKLKGSLVNTFHMPYICRFRQGRLYRYTLPVVDAASLTAFAIDGFRNARAENIPHPKTAL